MRITEELKNVFEELNIGYEILSEDKRKPRGIKPNETVVSVKVLHDIKLQDPHYSEIKRRMIEKGFKYYNFNLVHDKDWNTIHEQRRYAFGMFN